MEVEGRLSASGRVGAEDAPPPAAEGDAEGVATTATPAWDTVGITTGTEMPISPPEATFDMQEAQASMDFSEEPFGGKLHHYASFLRDLFKNNRLLLQLCDVSHYR